MRVGIDLGSTTAKMVVLDQHDNMIFKDYRRHNALISETLIEMIDRARSVMGESTISLAITGSAGLGVSERYGIPFVQEVVSAAETVRKLHPDVRTLIDVGGEDSKMIFFDDRMRVDIRMNGNCAGGTGAFIDQMATLLKLDMSELEEYVGRAETIHPIASRCGVFAKTDVQNLLARKVSKEDIIASIYHAVALQTTGTLSRGYDPSPKVMFCGGPFTFLPSLKEHFLQVLEINEEDVEEPGNSELVPALGAALYDDMKRMDTSLSGLRDLLLAGPVSRELIGNRLDPLFMDDEEFGKWSSRRMTPMGRVSSISSLDGRKAFLGIDSGSTTTKIVLMDEDGNIAYHYYSGNDGDPIAAVVKGLRDLGRCLEENDVEPEIARTAVTGYGEDLIAAALAVDRGMVETLAHFRAAREFLPEVSFILDIGGQDMKAIFIRNGVINDIEINEACSSGCGSFLETFSNTLGLNIEDFALKACSAREPYDLGTRCTVFMNSKVKQALREGATVGDISAGLAFSVVKNCLYKVLKIKDVDVLGDNIVVQGGTFRNPSVHRALELILGKRVVCTDMPELMGAYGAALSALDDHGRSERSGSTFIGLSSVDDVSDMKSEQIRCHGCQNRCIVTRMTFPNGKVFFTGNKCERIFTNKGSEGRKGRDLTETKLELLFNRKLVPNREPRGKIGVPRVLNQFENFPFWSTLLVESGFEVVLSPPSSMNILELGTRTVMSENICFPAKLVNGHMKKLMEMGVDRIFYPMVIFEQEEFPGSLNTFNCPIVSGYPDVVRSAVDPEGRGNIPLDRPTISFRDGELLRKGCWKYLRSLGVPKRTFNMAFEKALLSRDLYKRNVREESSRIVEKARKEKGLVILILGRPYHVDRLINHKITEMITSLGADVITEDSVPMAEEGLEDVQVLTQWQYPNRVYNAAKWALTQDNVEVVQLNSFGCGPDAIVCDEARAILASGGKNHTLLRIDELSSPGSIKLRLRSMMESLNLRGMGTRFEPSRRVNTPSYSHEDRKRKILVPHFSRFHSPFITAAFGSMGYDIETLPEPDRQSVEVGLKYCNNEICYPSIIVIGDLLKGLMSGRYDRNEVAVGITQTGGQCRASSYLSLLKKALISAGFEDVPVVTVSLSKQKLNEQPGFRIDRGKLQRKGVTGLLYADSIMQMYNSTVVRELEKGGASEAADRYVRMGAEAVMENRDGDLVDILGRAVKDFNAVETHDRELPVIGFVGEIYVKYSPFGNFFVVDWMLKNGVEVIVPPIFDFFAQEYLNPRFHVRSLTKPMSLKYFTSWPEEWYVRYHMRRFERVKEGFKHHRRSHYIGDLSRDASDIVTMVDQFGEGWLIPAEIGAFARDGINNVVCVQPFGCISNHIIGKGVEKALKARYPELNILYLDMDPGSSEVNIYNRLNFMVRSAREDLLFKCCPESVSG
ncbi:MAG: CoA activase [Thermoplasmata archaeon]|nr:MAG: CoA activase [Thermoplasmata archaeon]